MLEIRGLTKYFGGLAAVSELDMSIKQKDIVGLIGPNGAGKTTVFDLVTGFLRPTKGKIVLEGEDVTGLSTHARAKRGIVRTFQANVLFPYYSARQNVVAACHLNPCTNFWECFLHMPSSRRKDEYIAKRATEILELAGLSAVGDVLPPNLPHGHKRRLGIAIALAANPKLLLLDEPLSGMSTEEVAECIAIIEGIRQSGISILLIEHNMKAAMSLCDNIVVLNFGQKIAEGLPEEISGNEDVIRAYLGASKHVA